MSARHSIAPLLVLATAVFTVCVASMSQCPGGQFYSRKDHQCQPCSSCPKNQIIRGPCMQHRDTLCGPFFEFDQFHQAPRPKSNLGDLPSSDYDDDDIDDDVDSKDWHSNRNRKYSPGPFDDLDEMENNGKSDRGEDETLDGFDDAGLSSERDRKRQRGARKGPPASSLDDKEPVPSFQNPAGGDSRWKVLALALIGVLCIVCIFLIVFVFVVCYLRSSRGHLKKVFYVQDFDPAVRTLPRSNQYIPVLTNAPTAGSSSARAVPPCGMVDSSYLYSEEYDADHSGQTASIAKSSDYVYFKSPHNGNVCEV